MTTSVIVCPDCGTEAELDELTRSAEEFCSSCDFPLFWVPDAARAVMGDTASSGEGLRRLPGIAGRRELGAVSCPGCGEHQPLETEVCGRCHTPMATPEPEPEPVVAAPPPPPPPTPIPQPEPAPSLPIWLIPAVAAAVLLVIMLALIVF